MVNSVELLDMLYWILDRYTRHTVYCTAYSLRHAYTIATRHTYTIATRHAYTIATRHAYTIATRHTYTIATRHAYTINTRRVLYALLSDTI